MAHVATVSKTSAPNTLITMDGLTGRYPAQVKGTRFNYTIESLQPEVTYTVRVVVKMFNAVFYAAKDLGFFILFSCPHFTSQEILRTTKTSELDLYCNCQ